MDFIEGKRLVSSYRENEFWFGENFNLNIYKGCSHGCIYCDSRSSCYGVLDFDTVRAKKDSTRIIEEYLKKKRKKGVVGTGAMSDPYNPYEKKYELTREALKIIDKYNFGVGIATKSALISRDIDILKKIACHSEVIVKITITTFDDDLSSSIERSVSKPSERFKALKELNENGIYSGILLMPILPFINDTKENILNIVKKASECKAKFIYTFGFGVTLRHNQREYYYKAINDIFGDEIVEKYKKEFGENYVCNSPKSKELYEIFENECEKYGILYKMQDIINDYKGNYENTQLSLF